MKKVEFQYNPFTVETMIKINGQALPDGKLSSFSNSRLQMWVDKVFPLLAVECNDDIEFVFRGTQLDFNDVTEAAQEYQRFGGEMKISFFEPVLVKGAERRLKELIDLFDYLQQECPFDDLRTEQIRQNFYNAVGSEFEVSVIATMSSGKSTLINAMLGHELMPAKNEACTATIARIKDVDGKEGFSVICRDLEGKILCTNETLTAQIMDQYNSDRGVAYIEIDGDIPFVSSKNMQLVLLDTPGPNNSRTEEHKNHTYRVIKEKSKPMVLYVLNATQLSTNDDNYLLSTVAEAMKVGGKQSKDRFIFAVNKVDTFDVEKGESVADALDNVRDYLAKHGIEQPNIYPISAEMAKVIRLKKNGAELSRKQRRTLTDSLELLEIPQMHLEKYAPLSLQSKSILTGQMQKATAEYEEALIHTGLPAVEIAINEYLDKYALTNKVKTAVDTFRKKIEEKELMGSLMQGLKDNAELRQKMQARLQHIDQQLADGKQATSFRQRIQQLDISKEADIKFRLLRKKVTDALDMSGTIQLDTKMSRLRVEGIMMNVQRQVNDLQSDVRTDLEAVIDEAVTENAQVILEEYQAHIHSLIEDQALSVDDFSFNATLNLLTSDIPDANGLINRYKRTESVRVKIGEKWVENTNKHWYNPLTWFDESGYNEDQYETRQNEYINGSKVIAEYFGPIKRNFNDNLESAKQAALGESEKFKAFFFEELDKLDMVLQQKVNEMKKLSGDEKSLAKKIEEDESKKEWLGVFLKRLNDILEV